MPRTFVLTCEFCGKTFERVGYPSTAGAVRFCSKSCGAPARRIPQKGIELRPAVERFWEKVDRAGDCWIWAAGRNRGGYGTFRLHGVYMHANRAAWILTYGEIADGLHVCHHCDNPPCVRPAHMFLGTHQDNMADMVAKGRAGRKRAAS